MRYFFSVVCCLLTIAFLQAQNVIVEGFVVDSLSSAVLPQTYIRINHENAIASTINSGAFSVSCSRLDTIVFHRFGYVEKYLAVKNLPDTTRHNKFTMIVSLAPKMYELDSVSVLIPKPKREDSAFYAFALKQEDANALINPITYLYNLYSRDAKEKQEMRKILDEDFANQILDYKLNYTNLKQITHDPSFTPVVLKQLWQWPPQQTIQASDFELYTEAKLIYFIYRQNKK